VGGIPIRNLAVHIVTSTLSNAGTNSDVYFDIGPIGWKLDKSGYNDFESGDDDYYNLTLPSDYGGSLQDIHLTTNDILWMRLQLRGNDTWKPQTIELLVNGSVFARADVRGLALDADHWYWASSVPGAPAYSREEQFIHALKVAGSGFAEGVELSQPDWVQGLPSVCVTGFSYYSPAEDLDGFKVHLVSVENVQIGDHQYMLNPTHELSRNRWIMVAWRPSDYPSPQPHQVFRVCGELQWTKNEYGDYVLIPRNRTDTTFPR
jgi:hypothetical protein